MRDGLVWERNLVCIDSLLFIGKGWFWLTGRVMLVKDSVWTKVKKVFKRSMM